MWPVYVGLRGLVKGCGVGDTACLCSGPSDPERARLANRGGRIAHVTAPHPALRATLSRGRERGNRIRGSAPAQCGGDVLDHGLDDMGVVGDAELVGDGEED